MLCKSYSQTNKAMIEDQRKVFGIGMSKTGTSTLDACFRILGLVPVAGYNAELKALVRAGRELDPINDKFDYDVRAPLWCMRRSWKTYWPLPART